MIVNTKILASAIRYAARVAMLGTYKGQREDIALRLDFYGDAALKVSGCPPLMHAIAEVLVRAVQRELVEFDTASARPTETVFVKAMTLAKLGQIDADECSLSLSDKTLLIRHYGGMHRLNLEPASVWTDLWPVAHGSEDAPVSLPGIAVALRAANSLYSKGHGAVVYSQVRLHLDGSNLTITATDGFSAYHYATRWGALRELDVRLPQESVPLLQALQALTLCTSSVVSPASGSVPIFTGYLDGNAVTLTLTPAELVDYPDLSTYFSGDTVFDTSADVGELRKALDIVRPFEVNKMVYMRAVSGDEPAWHVGAFDAETGNCQTAVDASMDTGGYCVVSSQYLSRALDHTHTHRARLALLKSGPLLVAGIPDDGRPEHISEFTVMPMVGMDSANQLPWWDQQAYNDQQDPLAKQQLERRARLQAEREALQAPAPEQIQEDGAALSPDEELDAWLNEGLEDHDDSIGEDDDGADGEGE